MLHESEASREKRWDRLASAFEAAESQPKAYRAPILDRLVGTTGPTRREVDDMLAAADRSQEMAIERKLLDAAAAAGASSVAIGSRIGPWRIETLVATGGMGEVYRAERVDGAFEQRVAIKVMRVSRSSGILDPARRFENERRIMARLEHPEIVPIIDGGALADGRPYLVMPFVDAMPLRTYCETRPLSLVERIRLVVRIARAVGHAHARGVVHRDLKPSNILVGDDGRPHVLDFGIAKLYGDEHAIHTVAGGALLTPGYAAPEQLRGANAAPSADVYALALMLRELLTALGDERTKLRASVCEIARRALDEDPSARHVDATELAVALERALASHGGATLRREIGTRRGARLVALMLGTVAVGLAASAMRDGRETGAALATVSPAVAETSSTPAVIVPAVEAPAVPPPAAEPRAVAVTRYQTLKRLALASSATGRSSEAVQFMDSALSRVEERSGPTSVEAAIARGQRAVMLLRGGQLDEARREMLSVDSLLRRSLSPTDTLIAKTELWLGMLALWQSRPDSALAHFQAAHEIQSRNGRAHPMRAMAACGMGLSLQSMGETEAASVWRRPYCHLQRRFGNAYDLFVETALAGARQVGSAR